LFTYKKIRHSGFWFTEDLFMMELSKDKHWIEGKKLK